MAAQWTRPWYGVTHLTRGNNVATLSVHKEFTVGFFYVRHSGQCPWAQPEHVFIPQDGIGLIRTVEEGGRELFRHNLGKGQDHQAAAKAWAEKMVGG